MNLDNITSDETFEQAKNSNSSTTTDASGCRRSRKVNWTPSTEQETYRTVVINYSYGKMDQNQNQKQIQQPIVNGNGHGNGIRKRRTREMWKKSFVDMQDKQPQQDDLESVTKSESDLNLRRLYGSIQELKFEEKPAHKAEVIVEPIKVVRKEEVMAKPELKTICEDCEVIVISDDEDEEHQLKSVLNNSKTTSTTSHHLTISESTSTDIPDKLVPLDSMDNIEEKLQIKVMLPDNQQPKNNNNNNDSSSNNNGPSQKLKVKVQPTNSYKQRQLELHRARIAVEQKRLELLEVKLARERDEMIREQVLFEKELELKSSQLRQINEDRV